MQHLVLPCHWTQRSTIVADMIKSHGCAGRSIVFTDTKKDANELTASLSENCGAMALHGDIPQVRTPYKSAHFHKILHFFPTNSQASQKCSCSQITKLFNAALKCLLTCLRLNVLTASAQATWQVVSNAI